MRSGVGFFGHDRSGIFAAGRYQGFEIRGGRISSENPARQWENQLLKARGDFVVLVERLKMLVGVRGVGADKHEFRCELVKAGKPLRLEFLPDHCIVLVSAKECSVAALFDQLDAQQVTAD